ncbi:MAG: malectin domain-containing carbohydrate-binding protein [Candidatus Acidiferrales bacterium]
MKNHRIGVYASALALLLVAASFPAQAQVSYTTQHNDNQRTGDNLSETILNQSNVNVNTFGMLFKETVDDEVYATPLYVPGLTVNGATHNVVYVATVNNSVYAFDADTGGAALWHTNYGTPTNHTVVGQNGVCGTAYNDFQGNIGIVGTPVIDISADKMFFVAHTQSGSTHTQTLYAINILTGATDASTVVSASGFNAMTNNQRPALTLANGVIYVAWSSYCDVTPYHGMVVAYSEATLGQTGVFNDTSTGTQAGIWQAGQGVNVDSNGNIYVMTGNGTWDGSANFGESFVKLTPSTLTEEDYFTPSDYSSLNSGDIDLGSAGGLLIPGTNLMVGGGKAAIFYLLNTNNMGHESGSDSGAVQEFQVGFPLSGCSTGHIHGGPVYYNSSSLGPLIYVWSENDFMHEFKFNGSTFPSTTPYASSSMRAATCGMPGVMLSVSANGNNDSTAIVWGNAVLSGDANHGTVPGIIRAFPAPNVSTELWDSQQNASRDSCGNFAKGGYPVVVNGKLYVGSFGTATAGSGQLCVYGLINQNCTVPTTPGTLTATDVSAGQVSLSWGASTSSCSVTYNLFRSTTSGFTPSGSNELAGGLTSTSYADNTTGGSTTYYYLVEAVSGGGTSAPSNYASVTTPAYGSQVIAIDSGSTTAVSPFVADEDYTASSTISHANTIDTSHVSNPAPAAVYQTGRDTSTVGPGTTFTYTIPGFTANTNYLVRLHFCETFFTAAGSRTFNVSINGTQVLSNFDIFAASGAENRAIIEQFLEPANSSGQFVILFTSDVNNALISGIEIDSATGASCTAAPSTPSNLGATAVSSSQINMTWTASTAGSGCSITYNVYRSTTSGFTAGSGNQIATGLTTTSYSNTGLAASTTYYYLVEAVDSFGSSAASNQAMATTSASSGSCTSICIDSGSTTTVSPFVADEDFTGGATISHANTINLNNVTNPAPMAVYQTGRDGNFTYTIGGFTASSMHTVRLHFAETYWTACGQRTFNVSINSTSVLTDFDILCTAGGENIANIQQFSEAANSSGQYVIVFTTVVNNSLVSGIEID